MTKRQLQAFLIKFANPGPIEGYATVMSCSMTLLAVNGQAVQFERIGEALRSLIDNPATLTIAAQGTFASLHEHSRMSAAQIAGLPLPCELYFDGGMRIRARFLVGVLEFVSVVNGLAVFNVAIESVGGCEII